MAVPGRKISDLSCSISHASEEDFQHNCDPCFTIGQHIDAHGYCVDCQEHLCKTCYDCHLRTKASRNHQLIRTDKIDQHVLTTKDTGKCTAKCTVHRNEIIKFFCKSHEALGCNDCMVIQHRTCALDYIPDTCADIGDSEEYRGLVTKLEQHLKDAKHLTDEALKRNKSIESCYVNITKEIAKFRKEINERLDQLQDEMLKDVKNMMTTDKQKAQRVLDSCTIIISDMKKFQSSLHDQKIARKNGQLYITIKRAMSYLKTDELKKHEEALDETDVQYEYKRNIGLESIFRQENVGKIARHPLRHSLDRKPKLCTLTKWTDSSDFGFNLHAKKGTIGQYICKVDDNSPAQAAGLIEGDRIVEVEGANIISEAHDQVVGRIKAAGNSLTLLVVDEETDKYYKERKMVISSKMPGLICLGTSIY